MTSSTPWFLHALFAGLSLCAGSAAVFAAGAIVADSKISTVTVYRDDAIVTREATVNLEAGLQSVAFSGLPAGLDPNLVQVSGSGSAQATILEVVVAATQQAAVANARSRELQTQRRALQADSETAADRKTALGLQRDYLEKIKTLTTTAPGGDAQPLPDPTQWDKLLEFYSERQIRLAGELRTVEHQQTDLQERIDVLEREISDLEGSGERATKTIVVRCDVARAGALKLIVTYSVDDARWEPVYAVRVASADKSIALSYGASVQQSTGEDWQGVKLVLSTATPDRGGTPPVFSPWLLEDQTAVAARRMARKNSGSLLQYTTSTELAGVTGNFAGGGEGSAMPDIEVEKAETASAAVATGLTSATFTIPFPADIPADNVFHRVGIGSTALTGVMNHLAVPKLAEGVFLRARVTNNAEFPLVEGEVSIFLDGNFVSRSNLKTVMPGEKFVLNLGVDDGITAKRKIVNRLVENTGAFARRARVTYDTLITVENNHPTAETVIVKDQMPVSRHEKIVATLVTPAAGAIVKEEEATEDGAVRRADDGTISWTVKLKPGEKRELPMKITVEYPTDFPVFGLE